MMDDWYYSVTEIKIIKQILDLYTEFCGLIETFSGCSSTLLEPPNNADARFFGLSYTELRCKICDWKA